LNVATLKTVLKTTRPSFLVLTPVCIFLGLGSALDFHSWFSHPVIVLIFIGGMLSHISVNTLIKVWAGVLSPSYTG